MQTIQSWASASSGAFGLLHSRYTYMQVQLALSCRVTLSDWLLQWLNASGQYCSCACLRKCPCGERLTLYGWTDAMSGLNDAHTALLTSLSERQECIYCLVHPGPGAQGGCCLCRLGVLPIMSWRVRSFRPVQPMRLQRRCRWCVKLTASWRSSSRITTMLQQQNSGDLSSPASSSWCSASIVPAVVQGMCACKFRQ